MFLQIMNSACASCSKICSAQADYNLTFFFDISAISLETDEEMATRSESSRRPCSVILLAPAEDVGRISLNGATSFSM